MVSLPCNPVMMMNLSFLPSLRPQTLGVAPFRPHLNGQLLQFEGKKKERVAVYAGTFDPLTNGHLWVIQQARKLADKVHVVMAVNADKRPTFSEDERGAMFADIVKDMPGVEFHTISNQFLVDFAKSVKANMLIRGVRNAVDLEYEQTLCDVNRQEAPNIQTVILIPPKNLQHISSSFVRGLLPFINWRKIATPLVPPIVMQNLKALTLKNRWNRLSTQLGLDPKLTAPMIRDLLAAYTEKTRFYHNMDHLLDCFEVLDTYLNDKDAPVPINKDLLELSLWFHDIVDERGNPQGVDQSADRAVAFLGSASKTVTPAQLDQVRQNIMATKHFAPQIGAPNLDTQLMTDIDLAILGQSAKAYKTYRQQIRQEYQPLYGVQYAPGRAKVMGKFLKPERANIYQTDWFRQKYQAKAEKNIQGEITALLAEKP